MVHWRSVSFNQKGLSEDFIREFKDKVDWGYISEGQDFSYKFICEFREKLDLNILLERGEINSIENLYSPVNKYELIDI